MPPGRQDLLAGVLREVVSGELRPGGDGPTAAEATSRPRPTATRHRPLSEGLRGTARMIAEVARGTSGSGRRRRAPASATVELPTRRGSGYDGSRIDRAARACRVRSASDRRRGVVLGSLAALVWTHVGYPLAIALAARVRAPRLVSAETPRRRRRDRRGARRGERDRAPDREPARARLSARQARDRRHLGRLDRPHRGARRGRRAPA